MRIAKRFTFCAAHFLPHLPSDHKCSRMHGHTYMVEVQVTGEPDEHGMVIDFAKLEAAWRPVHGALDHRILNEVPGLERPTVEILASWILERFATSIFEVSGVRVWESPTSWCEALRERA